jgi:hypothetical protein
MGNGVSCTGLADVLMNALRNSSNHSCVAGPLIAVLLTQRDCAPVILFGEDHTSQEQDCRPLSDILLHVLPSCLAAGCSQDGAIRIMIEADAQNQLCEHLDAAGIYHHPDNPPWTNIDRQRRVFCEHRHRCAHADAPQFCFQRSDKFGQLRGAVQAGQVTERAAVTQSIALLYGLLKQEVPPTGYIAEHNLAVYFRDTCARGLRVWGRDTERLFIAHCNTVMEAGQGLRSALMHLLAILTDTAAVRYMWIFRQRSLLMLGYWGFEHVDEQVEQLCAKGYSVQEVLDLSTTERDRQSFLSMRVVAHGGGAGDSNSSSS